MKLVTVGKAQELVMTHINSESSRSSQEMQTGLPATSNPPKTPEQSKMKEVATKVFDRFKQSVDSLRGKESDYEFLGAKVANKGLEGAKAALKGGKDGANWVVSKFNPKPNRVNMSEMRSFRTASNQGFTKTSETGASSPLKPSLREVSQDVNPSESRDAETEMDETNLYGLDDETEFGDLDGDVDADLEELLKMPPMSSRMEYMEETVSAIGEDDEMPGSSSSLEKLMPFTGSEEESLLSDASTSSDKLNKMDEDIRQRSEPPAARLEEGVMPEAGELNENLVDHKGVIFTKEDVLTSPREIIPTDGLIPEKSTSDTSLSSPISNFPEKTRNAFQETGVRVAHLATVFRGLLPKSEKPAKENLSSPVGQGRAAQLLSMSPEELKAVPRAEVNRLTPTQLGSFSLVQFGALVPNGRVGKDSKAVRAEMFNRLMPSNGVHRAGEDLYSSGQITDNRENLANYLQSAACERHLQTVRCYYEADMDVDEARQMLTEREPVNISNGPNQYDKAALRDLSGYETSAYKRMDNGKQNVAAVYSETYMWPTASSKPIEVAVMSVYAPALDSAKQPNFDKYTTDEIVEGKRSLNTATYEAHMQKVANSIVQAALSNASTAFQGKGVERVAIGLYGQGAFLGDLNSKDQAAANQIFARTLANAIKVQQGDIARVQKAKNFEFVIADYSPATAKTFATAINEQLQTSGITIGVSDGDIKASTQARDLIINCWDPHSAPGNGNNSDHTFDGQIGRSTGILASQTNWLNPAMGQEATYNTIL